MSNSHNSSTRTAQRSFAGNARVSGQTRLATIPANARERATTNPPSASPHTKGVSYSFPRPDAQARQRFWSYVVKGSPTQCWEYHEPSTYATDRGWLLTPTFRVPGQESKAHVTLSRYAWAIHHGVAPARRYVRRTCQNTLCVNPAHLTLSTHPSGRVKGVSSPARKSNNSSAQSVSAQMGLTPPVAATPPIEDRKQQQQQQQQVAEFLAAPTPQPTPQPARPLPAPASAPTFTPQTPPPTPPTTPPTKLLHASAWPAWAVWEWLVVGVWVAILFAVIFADVALVQK